MFAHSLRKLTRRFFAVWVVTTLLAPVAFTSVASGQSAPRTAFVHLFEWRWDDIALECERFLGPKGFAAVQVSPPNEHRVVTPDPADRPWWERYQPVSYQICSRSGDRQAFEDMVNRCASVGVKIYVDAVINHMTGSRFGNDPNFGTGICGSSFDYRTNPTQYSYPAVPFEQHHFHNPPCEIQNFGDRFQVQNCNLLALSDLDTGRADVRGRIADYLNDLVNIGVRGFRIDAAKHMHTDDIGAILARVQDNPEVFQEVIQGGGEPIQPPEYFQNGLVTEFNYGRRLAEFFRNNRRLAELQNFEQGLMPSHRALVFVDNHDNQRGHGGGGNVLTHRDGEAYELANIFMLAYPYGYPRVMSSYAFDSDSQSPPRQGNATRRVYQGGSDPDCGDGRPWLCEHRKRRIANMVEFRNQTIGSFFVSDWWADPNKDQIAFARGDTGFVVFNKDGSPLERTFQTGLAEGSYCDVLSGDVVNGQCTGSVITVAADGTATIRVAANSAAATHVGAIVAPPEGQRTVILIESETAPGQDLFIRGGIDHGHANANLGRTCATNNFECAIPITRHNNLRNPTTAPWKHGERFLDWYGREAGQDGRSHGIPAFGTAADWTTNQWPPEFGPLRTVADSGFGEEPLNTFGPHYWMVDVDLDCSKTVDGFFEFKSFVAGGPGWEPDVSHPGAPWPSSNHFAKCGHLNVYRRGESTPVAIQPLFQ